MTESQNKDVPVVAENQQSATQNPQTPIIVQQKSGGKIMAGGALVLSLLALGASGFLFVQGQNLFRNQELALNQALDKAALGSSENAQLLQESLRKQAEFTVAMNALHQQQQQDVVKLDNMQAIYQDLVKNRADWLVNEIEATLNLASQQLLLSGNVPVAIMVLENIEQRLNRFDQPDLLPIKQAISQDLATLKNQPYLKVSSTVLRLDRLESSVSSLPLVLDSTLNTADKPEVVAESANFWTRTWNKTWALLKGMVEVRALDSTDALLLSPEQSYFMRENLKLRLLDARVALLQHNNDVFQNDLTSIETALKQYFDVNSPTTQSWLKELAEIKSLDVSAVSDDTLKSSLTAVREYQNRIQSSVALPAIQANMGSEAASSASASQESASDVGASDVPASAPTQPKA